MKYYTQRLACYYLRTVADIPNDLTVAEIYRQGLSNDKFVTALQQYRDIRIAILNDISSDPTAFDLVCLEIEENHGAVTKNEAKSIKSFSRIRDVLSVLAGAGNGCSFEGRRFVKQDFNGIVRPIKILNRLSDYGFIKVGNGEILTISYPDNPAILTVMRAFSMAGGDLIYGDPRVFNTSGKIEYEPADVIHLIPEQHIQELVRSIVALFHKNGYFIKTEYTYNPARIRISKTKTAKEIVNIALERDSRTTIHVRLAHIADYTDILPSLSPGVLHRTLSGRDCVHCGYCKEGGTAFTYGAIDYMKCSILCCGFSYSDLLPEDVSSLLTLLKKELTICTQ